MAIPTRKASHFKLVRNSFLIGDAVKRDPYRVNRTARAYDSDSPVTDLLPDLDPGGVATSCPVFVAAVASPNIRNRVGARLEPLLKPFVLPLARVFDEAGQ
ncbi:MAG: hypothetical protein ACI9VS_001619 [Candidatus Binatia bacterium]